MSILNFQKPDEVVMLDSDENVGSFEFRPLEPGYGLTIGNALRRVLLSSLEGFAITSIKIEGVEHEFSTIDGVIEDVTEIVLNLKKIRFKQQIEDENSEKAIIKVANQKTITAKDIAAGLSNFQVLNPDLVICNLTKATKLDFTITIKKGRGFVISDENKIEDAPLGTIFTDSVFTPIKNIFKNFFRNILMNTSNSVICCV